MYLHMQIMVIFLKWDITNQLSESISIEVLLYNDIYIKTMAI